MNVTDAAHATVHDYPGGAAALSVRVKVGPVVLSNKVNPNTTSHHLTLAEAMRIMALTGDHRILAAQCDELGYLPPVPRVDFAVSDSALLETYTRMMSELGDVSRSFHDALVDGKLTMTEVDKMRAEMMELFAAGEELLNRAAAIAED